MILYAQIVALTGLILGSLEDLRTREVPDWLNFALIFTGVAIGASYSIARWDVSFILQSTVGLGVAVAVAYLMFYTGQWGGGDSKLLMGLGALLGIRPALDHVPLFAIFMLNLFLLGAVFGIFWACSLAIRHWSAFKEAFCSKLRSDAVTLARKIVIGVVVVCLVGAYLAPAELRWLLLGSVFFLYGTLYLWIVVTAVESSCMVKHVDVEDLVEGDWIMEEVEVDGEVIHGPDDLGIEQRTIDQMREHDIDAVLVKEGVPFVPSFLLAFVVTIWFENWLVLF
jgi:Flp pilus assembly protein protease CpaA